MDSAGGFSVTVWICDAGHPRACRLIKPHSAGEFPDPLRLRANQKRVAGFDSFRPLGRIAHDKYGLPKRRGFLLHTSRIGQDDKRCAQHSCKRHVIQWLKEMDVRAIAELLSYDTSNIGIEMDGKADLR